MVLRSPRILGMLLTIMLPAAACATPLIQQQFKDIARVRAGTRLDLAQCKSCHTVPPKLNPFGLDMRAEMTRQKTKTLTLAVWKKLATRDSDKDGVSNQREVESGTLPGDPKSKPATRVRREESQHRQRHT